MHTPLSMPHACQQEALAADYADLIPGLTALARSMVRELDALNDREFVRIRSAKHEIMVAPSERPWWTFCCCGLLFLSCQGWGCGKPAA